jgi:hypothetical protein
LGVQFSPSVHIFGEQVEQFSSKGKIEIRFLLGHLEIIMASKINQIEEGYNNIVRHSLSSRGERLFLISFGERLATAGELGESEERRRRDTPGEDGEEVRRALKMYHKARRGDRIETNEHRAGGVNDYDEARRRVGPLVRRLVRDECDEILLREPSLTPLQARRKAQRSVGYTIQQIIDRTLKVKRGRH